MKMSCSRKCPSCIRAKSLRIARSFKNLYDGLSIELKLCLLCFAVFPENAIIKKRVMVY